MDYSKHIKFGGSYTGEWPYLPHDGVGLEFTGIPHDKHQFLDILMGVSCNPIAARRILDVLESGQKKQVTVMAGLRFDDLIEDLKRVGVHTKIIPPFQYAKNTDIQDNAKMDMAALEAIKDKPVSDYVKDLTMLQQEEVQRRILQTRESMKKLPHGLGCY